MRKAQRTARSFLPIISVLALIGSLGAAGFVAYTHFASKPTVPIKSIVADINTDMFLPLYPLKIMTVYGLEESTLGDDVRAIARQMNIEVQADPEPKRNVFIRSDQYNFVRHGIPSVMVDIGNNKGSKEAAIEAKWLAERYHAPSDDLNQPIDKQAAGMFDQFVGRLVERVANQDARPAWKPSSFFKRYSAN